MEYLKSFEHHCLIMEVRVTHYGVALFYAADGENAGAVVCCSILKYAYERRAGHDQLSENIALDVMSDLGEL